MKRPCQVPCSPRQHGSAPAGPTKITSRVASPPTPSRLRLPSTSQPIHTFEHTSALNLSPYMVYHFATPATVQPCIFTRIHLLHDQ